VTNLLTVDSKQIQLPMEQTVVEKLGSAVALSTCMLGALLTLRDIINPEAVIKVLEKRIPEAFYDMNVEAFRLGQSLARENQ
jgi:2-oxoglutarate ferredoxin oxidoreductase subunit gamma